MNSKIKNLVVLKIIYIYVHVLGCKYLNKVCVIFVVMEQRVQLSVAGIADNCELPNVDAVN